MKIKVLTQEAYEAIVSRIAQIRDRYDHELEEVKKDRLYTTEEVCQLLQRTPATISNYRRDGKLSYIQIGRRCLYRWSDIQPLINARFIKAA